MVEHGLVLSNELDGYLPIYLSTSLLPFEGKVNKKSYQSQDPLRDLVAYSRCIQSESLFVISLRYGPAFRALNAENVDMLGYVECFVKCLAMLSYAKFLLLNEIWSRETQ